MCSVGDTDGIIEMIQETRTLDITKGDVMCRKCGEEAAHVVLRVRDAYCRACFLAYFIHKFRSTIGKSKQIHPGDRVLVCVSGGNSSTALLHLIKQGTQENSHKKLRFEPVFLHVDESVLHGPSDEGCEDVNRVIKDVTSLGFPCYVTSLEQIFSSQPCDPVLITQDWKEIKHPVDTDLRKKCSDLFANCRSGSAQQDLHDHLIQRVLMQSAHCLGFSKVFLGDNSTTMATRILSQVALGRGSHLHRRVHFRSVCEGVEVYRPMRELLDNEITHYLSLQDITSPNPPTFKHKTPSITSCTEEFIRSLQKDFPATTPTIFRTGDKLISSDSAETNKERDKETSEDENHCVLCASNLDTDKGEASALHATVVSQRFSNKKHRDTSQNSAVQGKCDEEQGKSNQDRTCKEVPSLKNEMHKANECKTNQDGDSVPRTQMNSDASVDKSKLNEVKDSTTNQICGCDRGGGGCNASKRNVKPDTPETMEEYLCYGCRVTLRDVKDIQLLPACVWDAMKQRKKRRDLREQIQDFLL